MVNIIEYPIKLDNKNIIPKSEKIRYKNQPLIHHSDDQDGHYIIDYEKGELYFTDLDLSVVEPESLDITYNFDAKPKENISLHSHKEIFNERVEVIGLNLLKVKNKPVSDVFRVENITTNEQYDVLSISRDEIEINGSPRFTQRNVKLDIYSNKLDSNTLVKELEVKYPEDFNEADNYLTQLDGLRFNSYWCTLAKAKTSLQSEYVIPVPMDTVSITIKTGGTTVERSKINLIEGIEYLLEEIITAGKKTYTINFTEKGKAKIGLANELTVYGVYFSIISNLVVTERTYGTERVQSSEMLPYQTHVKLDYIPVDATKVIVEDSQLNDITTALEPYYFDYNNQVLLFRSATDFGEKRTLKYNSSTYLGKIRQHVVSETVEFISSTRTVNFLKYTTYTKEENNTDKTMKPKLTAISLTRPGITFIENTDFTIDVFGNKISKTITSSIQQDEVVQLIYDAQGSYNSTATIQQDIIVIDYEYGNNTLDWLDTYEDSEYTETHDLAANTHFVVLEHIPADPYSVKIFLAQDFEENKITSPIEFESDTKRLFFKQLRTADRYVFKYIRRKHSIAPETEYFVSYKYGARRFALEEGFAKLLGIDTVTGVQSERLPISAGQSSIILSHDPRNLDDIVIYEENDKSHTAITTITSYDDKRKTLHFTPVRTSGIRVVSYTTKQFFTNELRTVIKGLNKALPMGGVPKGYKSLISTITGLDPVLRRAIDTGFRIADTEEESSPLSPVGFMLPEIDGEITIPKFVPSRFNAAISLRKGVLLDSNTGSHLKLPAINNLSIREGTIEFLLGTFFNSDDNKDHYILDLGSEDNKSRFSILKDKFNNLRFEIRDSKARSFRVTSDIKKRFKREVHFLNIGDTYITLEGKPITSTTDIGSSSGVLGVADIYEASNTQFLIYPKLNEQSNNFIRRSTIQAKQFDPLNNRLTFEPSKSVGYHVFEYIEGWSAYEETEHFITATWKTHIDDGKPPFLRLAINGTIVKEFVWDSTLTRVSSLIYGYDDEYSAYGYGYGVAYYDYLGYGGYEPYSGSYTDFDGYSEAPYGYSYGDHLDYVPHLEPMDFGNIAEYLYLGSDYKGMHNLEGVLEELRILSVASDSNDIFTDYKLMRKDIRFENIEHSRLLAPSNLNEIEIKRINMPESTLVLAHFDNSLEIEPGVGDLFQPESYIVDEIASQNDIDIIVNVKHNTPINKSLTEKAIRKLTPRHTRAFVEYNVV